LKTKVFEVAQTELDKLKEDVGRKNDLVPRLRGLPAAALSHPELCLVLLCLSRTSNPILLF
jgi:hypothetical protein